MIFLNIALVVIIILLLIVIAISLRPGTGSEKAIAFKIDSLYGEVQRVEHSVKTEIAANRKETFEHAAMARRELANSLASFEEKLNHLTSTIDHKLTAFSDANTSNAKDARTELKLALETFKRDLG